MKLKEYLARKELSLKDFCESIEYTTHHVRACLKGKTKMSRKCAMRIEKATEGQIKAKHLMSNQLRRDNKKLKAEVDKKE